MLNRIQTIARQALRQYKIRHSVMKRGRVIRITLSPKNKEAIETMNDKILAESGGERSALERFSPSPFPKTDPTSDFHKKAIMGLLHRRLFGPSKEIPYNRYHITFDEHNVVVKELTTNAPYGQGQLSSRRRIKASVKREIENERSTGYTSVDKRGMTERQRRDEKQDRWRKFNAEVGQRMGEKPVAIEIHIKPVRTKH